MNNNPLKTGLPVGEKYQAEPLLADMTPQEKRSAILEHLETQGELDSLNVSYADFRKRKSRLDFKLIAIFFLLAILLTIGGIWIGRSSSKSSDSGLPKVKTIIYDTKPKQKVGEDYVGEGHIYYPDGAVYTGSLKNDEKHGKGELKDSSGRRFKGAWNEGKKEGLGVMYLPDGSKEYTGSYKNDLYEGKGTLYYSNNSEKYVGEWKAGLYDGEGILYFQGGQKKYEGGWKEGKRDGKGLFYDGGGNVKVDGEYKNDLIEGKATYYWSRTGNKRYEGEWSGNVYNGEGILYWENEVKRYEGSFFQAKKNGKGTLYDEKGKIVYEGEWKINRMNGKGTYHYENGEIYVGTWLDDKRSGKGVHTYLNKEKYDGYWKNDMRNGDGILYSADGNKIKEGEWKDDQFVK